MKRALSIFVWLLAASTVVGSIWFGLIGLDSDGTPMGMAQAISWRALPAVFAVTAAIIVGRQPGNVIGWLLMVPALTSLAGDFVSRGVGLMDVAPDRVDLGLVAALAFDNFNWVLLVFPVFHLLLVFPTGSLLSRRWWWVPVLEVSMMVIMIVFSVFTEPIAPFNEAWSVDNPIGLIPRSIFDGQFLVFWVVGLLVITVSGVTSMVLRFRRSAGVERQQIKWFLYAVALFGVVYVYSAVATGFGDQALPDLLMSLSFIAIAVAVAIAVLRYRLFEIDRLVSRTVGYALVVGILGLAYAGGTVWLPQRFGVESPLFVAAATLAVAALFNPVRRRVLHWVDRRFYRSRYDAEVVAADFSERLKDKLDLSQLADEWVAVAIETMQPASVGFWAKGSE